MTPIERAALAVKAELRRQEVLWEDDEEPHILMMRTGQTADLYSVIRVVLQAIRDPSVKMADDAAALGVWSNQWLGSHESRATEVWEAMIDAALEERAAKD